MKQMEQAVLSLEGGKESGAVCFSSSPLLGQLSHPLHAQSLQPESYILCNHINYYHELYKKRMWLQTWPTVGTNSRRWAAKFLTWLARNLCQALTPSSLSPQRFHMPALKASKYITCTQVSHLFIFHIKCWVGPLHSCFKTHLLSLTPWYDITIQHSSSKRCNGAAVSKDLLQALLGATLKFISNYRFLSPHMGAVRTGHETPPVPDFSSYRFAFGENSKGFLKEMFRHLCYRTW